MYLATSEVKRVIMWANFTYEFIIHHYSRLFILHTFVYYHILVLQ